MSKRKRKVIPFPASKAQVQVRALTDKERLLYEQFIRPAEQAVVAQQAALQAAREIVVEYMASLSGVDLDAGWRFNVETLRWEKFPKGA